jgi:hypothetical protein
MASVPAQKESRSPIGRRTCTWSQLAVLVLLEVLILYTALCAIGSSQSISRRDTIAETKHAPQAVIFGHVHMAKTGGTELNGELALRFERVCGHKGYSYDAFQTNLRFNNSASHDLYHQNDSISKIMELFNRGRVPLNIMDEIGYENCDYISFESEWQHWSQFNSWDVPMELHVPCRNPVDHLMSNCNHRKKVFDCNADLSSEINKCLPNNGRFSAKLESSFANIHLKCFDFRKTFHEYIEYMGERLQRKRIQSQYVHRESNPPRNKTNECVWNSHVYEAVEAYLVENYDYYRFCNRCIGSEDDLLA